MSEAPYDSRAIANEILHYAHEKGLKLTIMQLIKLVYLANGWSLALLDYPLIDEPVQAWQYGPVIPNVYRTFNRFRSAPITGYAVEEFSGHEYRAPLDEAERRLIRAVVDTYGHMHAFKLSEIMHQPNTPWNQTYESQGPYSVIPENVIKDHFSGLSR